MVMLRAPRGMNDLFAAELSLWRDIEEAVHETARIFGFDEIRTPLLEDLALFKRGIGEGTDIVEKEMFVIDDGDNHYCLRPENTASVVRALIERGGIGPDYQEKLYYLGPMFRKERPQKGRLRQFHQFGCESFGVAEPLADIEIIAMVHQLFKTLKLSGVELRINSLGLDGERASYREILRTFFSANQDKLCTDCKRRLQHNPLRVLDCKNPSCGEIAVNAPAVIDTLGQESRKHFDDVLAGLSQLGIGFSVDNRLVRGLDYYQRTVFEFVAQTGLGSQNALGGGGRYDGLFTTLGNKIDVPAIGFAGGIERIAMLMAAPKTSQSISISLVAADDEGFRRGADMVFRLRAQGVAADFCLTKKSLKAQMRRADKLGSGLVAVIGQDEIDRQKITIKSMTSDEKWEVGFDVENISQVIIQKFN